MALVQLRRCPPNDLNRYPDIEDIFGASQWEQAAQIKAGICRSPSSLPFHLTVVP
jgi:hypothetical protein